jgi:hypothetical protein
MSNYDDSGFLFATPSFWQGAASVLDLGATLVEFNRFSTVEEADLRGIASDWAITGKDIKAAIESFTEKE